MREIKFRAWDVKNKFMYYAGSLSGVGDLFLSEYRNTETVINTIGYEALYNTFSTINYIWQQYTCLKDKNNIEICEGDIIKAYKHYEDEFIGEVKFHNGCFMFLNWNWHEFLNIFRNIEVIGNIYNNPDLLKPK